MSKSDTTETALLRLLFNNQNFASVGDGTGIRGSTAAGDLYVSLHSADPGEAGTQATNEFTLGEYPTYARVAVPRSAGGWTITGPQVVNTAAVTFPLCVGGTSQTARFWSIGVAASGGTTVLYKGALTTERIISNGVTPEFAPGTIVVNED